MFMRFIALPALLLATSIVTAQQSTAEVPVDAAAKPPITIDADRSDADFPTGITRFNDNVSIQRGAMQVNADEGVVHQIDGRIALIELFGSPTTWRDRLDDGSIVNGRANRIEYDVIENVVTLTGDAHLEHEGGQFTGNQLIYDLDTESLAGRSSEGNQVRVVIEGDTMRRQTSGDDDPPEVAEPEPESEPESEDSPDDDEEPPVDPPARR
ncbi:MAG: lipopolysaccharide transport periplasmic protein LptA [Wenzhouxiangellaceae bacterium]